MQANGPRLGELTDYLDQAINNPSTVASALRFVTGPHPVLAVYSLLSFLFMQDDGPKNPFTLLDNMASGKGISIGGSGFSINPTPTLTGYNFIINENDSGPYVTYKPFNVINGEFARNISTMQAYNPAAFGVEWPEHWKFVSGIPTPDPTPLVDITYLDLAARYYPDLVPSAYLNFAIDVIKGKYDAPFQGSTYRPILFDEANIGPQVVSRADALIKHFGLPDKFKGNVNGTATIAAQKTEPAIATGNVAATNNGTSTATGTDTPITREPDKIETNGAGNTIDSAPPLDVEQKPVEKSPSMLWPILAIGLMLLNG